MSIPDFNLGDFIEELPYEGGPGSPDEYIANALLIKRLELRNEELKPTMLEKDKRYLASSDRKHYIGVTRRTNYEYSSKIAKLEAEVKAMRELIRAKKAIEAQHGDAIPQEPTEVLSVRAMTQVVLERINANNDALHPEDDDDL